MTSPSNLQLVIDALNHYANLTGTDLSKNPFAEKLQLSHSPDAILELLHERERAFKEYRDGHRTLMKCLSPAVRVLHAFSATLGEALSLVPFPPAKAVLVGIDILLVAACDISSSYDALLDLFESMSNFLKRLEIYTQIPPTPIMTDIVVKIMAELLSVLALATKQIKQGRLKKFAKKLLGEGEVEAVLQRLDRLTQDEARVTVAQTLGVVHGLVNNMKVVMEDGEVSTDGIRQALVALQQMVNEMNKMKRDQLQRDVQHWLSPPDPSANHDFVWRSHHSGTAAWFFGGEVLTEWNANGSFLWIHGKPGSGKSTLLSAIIEDIENMRVAGLATMAYYYFDFRDVKKQDRYGLLSSLVSQLSAESDSCYEVLSQLYSKNAGGTRRPTSGALTKCLKEMLSLPGHVRTYIIIDALDECPNISGTPSAREEILELIEELVGLNLPNLHLCVTSRPEIDIRIVLEPLTSLQISLHDENGQKEDIIEYIKSVVRSDRRMRKWREEDQQLVIDMLSEKADGMFRWVVCQIDRLRRSFPASIRIALDELPRTLDETYGHMLLGIDEEKRGFAQRLLRCLTVSIRPLRVEELAEVLAVQFDTAAPPTFNPDWRPADAQEAVLSACSSLIAIVNVGGFQIVQFSHFSVKEFLTSERLATAAERLAYYHILPEPAHAILAHASLSVLLQLDDKIDRNSICHFPLAPYASRYWVDHAHFANMSSQLQSVMERLFDRANPHLAAWLWLHDIDHHWVDPMSEMRPPRPSAMPLYYASLCGFRGLVEHLIVAYPLDVDAGGGFCGAPLHAAAAKGRLEVAELLLQNGADPNLCGDDGWTPLHHASRYGHLEIARVLLDRGVDVDAKDEDGYSSLHLTSIYGKLETAQLLVQCGAVVDMRNDSQETPLHCAATYGKLKIAQLLLNAGASVMATDDQGSTPLHTAARGGYRDVVDLLFRSGASIDALTTNQKTALVLACRKGALEVARFLVGHGSDVNSQDKESWTPLHYASGHGHVDVARFLLDHGAVVGALRADHCTPLHLASANGYLDIVKLLIERGANVDSRNETRETSLDRASDQGHLDVTQYLVGCGAAVSSRDDDGWTPFHKASKSGHLRITKFLLLECGVDIEIRSRDEETSLLLASSSGKLDIVRFLIEHGADIHTKDDKGSNPLHIASLNGRLDVVRLLIDTGVAVDIPNGTQATPLALASSQGNVDVSRFLIERGADMNARDNRTWAPLHLASRRGHLATAQLLLNHGIDANVQDVDFLTPLHLASENGRLKVARLLIQRGARVEVFNKDQETPLHRAVSKGSVEIARLLIDHGANLFATDSNGCTPLHTASQFGHLDVVKLLLRRGAHLDALNKAHRTVIEMASENNKPEVASFLSQYKADASVRHKTHLSVSGISQHSRDGEGGEDKGRASLHTASEDGNFDLVKSLLELGPDINARNVNFNTPLYLAATKGKLDIVQLLIERGADVNSRDKFGSTALHQASREGYLEVSQVLVDHGANVNARDLDRWTPMHLSAYNGHLQVVELLLEHGADVHALDDEGRTPYRISLGEGNRKIAELLRQARSTMQKVSRS